MENIESDSGESSDVCKSQEIGEANVCDESEGLMSSPVFKENKNTSS